MFPHKVLLQEGVTALGAGDAPAAAAAFEKALALEPSYVAARKPLAQAYYLQGRYADAVREAEAVIRVEPSDPANNLNLGICLFGAKRYTEAAEHLARGLASTHATAQHRLIRVKSLARAEDWGGAFAALEQLRSFEKDLPELAAVEFEMRQRTASWEDYDGLLAKLRKSASLPGGFIIPSTVLTAPTLGASDHRRIAEAWTARVCHDVRPLPPASAASGKIRLGYISPDLQQKHPIGRHFHEVFAAHDRAQFDVIGYSLRAKHDASAPLYEAFDRVHFVEALSDEAIAGKIRSDGIEILADLGIHSDFARPQILAARPAPVQVTMIGHGGTLGAKFMDYVLTYAALPAGDEFTESSAILPGAFLNGAWNRPDARPVTRAETGIAEDAVVFSSFSAITKITPSIFAIWMRLLKDVPNSVLWLRDFGPLATSNFQVEARAAGVSPERLRFAPIDSTARFIGRLQCADLFLDTAPFSAGSSATDALWAGLPIVTLAGETYVSRMAASCLVASGLRSLVTTSPEGYFAKALELARDRGLRERIRAQLVETRGTNSLFDAVGYTRALESLYRQMSARSRAGEKPATLTTI